jgi:hypothetical protein
MKLQLINMRVAFASLLLLSQSAAIAQPAPVIKPLAEIRVTALPAGPLFWRLENFSTLAQAQAAAGPLGLVAQAEDRVWLFTLGAPGRVSAGATKVAELGPIPEVVATQYLLRIQEAIVSPGGGSAVHTHPGSESFYMVAGERSTLTPAGVSRVSEGAAGPGAGTPQQALNRGSTEMRALVMFVLDAAKPPSSSAQLP